MKVAVYKGYDIEFEEWRGEFAVSGVSGHFQRYKDATNKIDILVKAEMTKNLPIDVVAEDMRVGKITSYNKAEEDAWFVDATGKRSKEHLFRYTGQPRLFKTNENNLSIVRQYHELTEEISLLSSKRFGLAESLSEPITFAELDTSSKSSENGEQVEKVERVEKPE